MPPSPPGKVLFFAPRQSFSWLGHCHDALCLTRHRSLTIPSQCKYIHDFAFAGCSQLTVRVVNPQASYGELAFQGAYKVEQIRAPPP